MKKMVKEKEGRDLTDQEAHEAAYNYLNFFNMLIYLDRKQKRNKLEQTNMDNIENVEKDSLYTDAKRLALEDKAITREKLQRFLKIGYGRSAALIDELARDGVIPFPDGISSKKLSSDATDEEYLDEIRRISGKLGKYPATAIQRHFGIGYSKAKRLIGKL